MEHFDLGEDVEVVKLVGVLLSAEGVVRRGFCHELAPCVFIKDLGPVYVSVPVYASGKI